MASMAGDGNGNGDFAAPPLSIVSPVHGTDGTSVEEHPVGAAMEVVEDAENTKGIKRNRQDSDLNPQEAHKDGEELDGADDIMGNDAQEPESKKAKNEGDNGNVGINTVEVENTCVKVNDETETDKGTEAEGQDPVDGSDELLPSINEPEDNKEVDFVQLGPKVFHSGAQMFTYFYDLLHGWILDYNVNKYEKLVLSDLLRKGHQDADIKIGTGIQAFQIKNNPKWRSRCYYVIRTDGSLEDFSYRKCVDKLMPLPPELFLPSGSLNVDSLLSIEKGIQKVGDEAKSKDGQAWSKGSHGDRGRGGGGRRGGNRGRGRFHHRR